MGTRIPLPRYDKLPEGVYFHREDPTYPRLVLQVPDDNRVDSETYLVDLDDSIHKSWMEGLENSRNLLNTLSWAQHVAYCPRTGYFEEMADLDAVSPTAERVALARKEAGFRVNQDRLHNRFRGRQVPPPSKLREALSGRRPWR